MEERNLKAKLIILLVSMALLVGILSGCTETTTTDEENTAPEASFTPAIEHNTSIAGGTVTFTSTASDADNDTLTYTWVFGDDTSPTEASDVNPVHVYAANDSYDVTLTVNDGTVDYTTDATTIIVGNVAPAASFDNTPTNLTVNFTGTSTDANTDDTLTYSWDFGDDVGNSTDQSPEYTYAAAGTYNVTLTVTDSFGLTDTTEITAIEVTAATED